MLTWGKSGGSLTACQANSTRFTWGKSGGTDSPGRTSPQDTSHQCNQASRNPGGLSQGAEQCENLSWGPGIPQKSEGRGPSQRELERELQQELLRVLQHQNELNGPFLLNMGIFYRRSLFNVSTGFDRQIREIGECRGLRSLAVAIQTCSSEGTRRQINTTHPLGLAGIPVCKSLLYTHDPITDDQEKCCDNEYKSSSDFCSHSSYA